MELTLKSGSATNGHIKYYGYGPLYVVDGTPKEYHGSITPNAYRESQILRFETAVNTKRKTIYTYILLNNPLPKNTDNIKVSINGTEYTFVFQLTGSTGASFRFDGAIFSSGKTYTIKFLN